MAETTDGRCYWTDCQRIPRKALAIFFGDGWFAGSPQGNRDDLQTVLDRTARSIEEWERPVRLAPPYSLCRV